MQDIFMKTTFRVICLILLTMFSVGCEPPAVYDGPASNLDVQITILDDQSSSSDIPVIALFLYQGKAVQFGNSVQITCDGINLKKNGSIQGARVPKLPIGGKHSFAYSWNGSTTTIEITVLAPPVITSPTNQATVIRTNNLSISYIAGNGVGMRGSYSDGSTAIGANPDVQLDNGLYTGIDGTQLKAGPGSVLVTREYEQAIANSGFKSAKYTYDTSSASIKVILQ